MKKFSLVIFTVSFFVHTSAQQAPLGRASAHLFYFPPLKYPILIDGYEKMDNRPEFSEVWQWKNNRWKKINIGGYDSRTLSAAAINTDKNELYVFGGIGREGYNSKKSDMYKFYGSAWKQIETNDIGTRDHHEMVYASHLKSLIMYGGVNAERMYDSLTWLFQDNQWKSLKIDGRVKGHIMQWHTIH